MRLLVVEDEKDVANALHVGLSRDGYAVDIDWKMGIKRLKH